MYWTCCAALACGSARLEPGNFSQGAPDLAMASPSELEVLAAALEQRDLRLGSILLSFHAREESSPSGVRFEQHGMWARSASLSGLDVTTVTELGERHSRGVWDGHTYSSIATMEDEYPVIVRGLKKGAPFSLYTPDFFGLWWGDIETSKLLKSEYGGRLSVLGRETVRERDCMLLVQDAAPPLRNGTFGAPVLIWIDDKQTLLNLKVQRLTPVRSESGRPDNARELGGDLFEPVATWEVLAEELVQDVWIPSEGRLVSLGQRGPMSISIDADSVVLNDSAAIERFISISNDRWYTVVDNRTGEITAQSPYGPSDEGSMRFYVGVWEDQKWRRIPKSEAPDPQIRFESASCGPRALFHVAVACQMDVRLERVLGAFAPDAKTAESVSLSELSQAAVALGLSARTLECSLDRLLAMAADPAVWVIAHMTGDLHADDSEHSMNHFSVVSVSGGRITEYSPPNVIIDQTPDEFASRWTRHVLVLSRAEISDQSVGLTVPGKAWPFVVASICLVALACVGFEVSRRRRSKRA